MNLREKKMLTGNTSPFSKMNVSVTRRSDNKYCNNYGPHIPEAEEKKIPHYRNHYGLFCSIMFVVCMK